ncbi:nucleotidyltransferase family protein [Demequina rhizosphaerae]|uniref:nucleotidyltransferase family protein n=1 Tax=Demequina rhizosphaerae TaxID=1638985 RepID=UPI00078084EA|nr:nucleotidyltransferase family protein [Demequina rhizosphaerae]
MSARLAARDAVQLAHVLAVEVAREAGVRALVIKGPTASAHGLRPDRASADADVLIAPGDEEAYLRALVRCGWRERAPGASPDPDFAHSATVLHPQWPCDIDVHRTYPGFIAPPVDVFEALWRRRTVLVIAGREVDAVDRNAAILIGALHALRSAPASPRHGKEIRRLADEVVPALGGSEQADLVALASAIGAVDSARPVLERVSAPLPPPRAHGEDAALDEWRSRVGGHGGMLAQWIPRLARASRRDRMKLLRRVVWPSEEEFRRTHPATAQGRRAAVLGRLARVGRGVRATPRALWGAILARRGVTDASVLRDDV